MIASTSSGKAARLRRAVARADSAAPMCRASAPQQAWPGGITTSTPFAASTWRVARLMPGASTCCAQPASSATRARRGPCAGKILGNG